MNNIVRSIVLIVVLMVTVLGFPKVSFGAENTEYISDVKIVSATSEEEAIRQLTEAGYIPVKNNLSNEKVKLSSPFVYFGFKTTKNPSRAMETIDQKNVGSIFGDSALMIGGIGMIIGLIIAMISMKVRPQVKNNFGNDNNRD